jgi:hypothetical protein
VWSSEDMTPYLGVTAHFISSDGALQEELVRFLPLIGSHSGKHLADAMLGVLKMYNLLKKVSFGLLLDNHKQVILCRG